MTATLLARRFVADHLRNPVNLFGLVAVPVAFVLVAAGPLAEAGKSLGTGGVVARHTTWSRPAVKRRSAAAAARTDPPRSINAMNSTTAARYASSPASTTAHGDDEKGRCWSADRERPYR